MEVRNDHIIGANGIHCPKEGFIQTGSYPAGEICPGCQAFLIKDTALRIVLEDVFSEEYKRTHGHNPAFV